MGDILVLKEWNSEKEEYTRREITKKVTYILEGGSLGLEKAYVIMALTDID